jgi:membrane protease YdiL (CAAX protease family)
MNQKLIIRWIVGIGLIFPMFFIDPLSFLISGISWINFMWFSIAGLGMAIGGYFLLIKGLRTNQLNQFSQHNIIQAIKNKDLRFILTDFFNSMIFEEGVFRYYIFGMILIPFMNIFIAIILNGLIFALYHIHMYFKFPSKRFLGIILLYTFLLAVYLGFLFVECGFFGTLIAHIVIVSFIYFLLSKGKFN